MPDLEKAKTTAIFFAGTSGKPHFVVDNNRDGSTDKFIAVALEKLLEKNILLTDPRIVFSTEPIEEIKAKMETPAKTSAKAPSAEKAPAATEAAKPATEKKAPAAAKAPAAKSTVAAKPAAVPAPAPVPVKCDFTMVSVHNDQYNWLLEHGLNVPQGLMVAQKYHASIEKQNPGTGDAMLQKLTAPKVT